MFISALGSITGKHNRLGLPKVQSACVVVVDGLGSANLRYRAGHAPFLANQLNTDGSIMCGFPSTTVASLASFSTGVSAGEHGLVGYQIYDVKSFHFYKTIVSDEKKSPLFKSINARVLTPYSTEAGHNKPKRWSEKRNTV